VSLVGFTFQRYGPDRKSDRGASHDPVESAGQSAKPLPADEHGDTDQHVFRRWDRDARLNHLRGLDPFEIGPYEQVASVFRRHGFEDDADVIIMAGRREARRLRKPPSSVTLLTEAVMTSWNQASVTGSSNNRSSSSSGG
jgi:hypothetical protein